MVIPWVEMNSCNKVESLGSQFSLALPLHVPRSDRQTLPHEYKLGLNLIFPCPVVAITILGGLLGYESSQYKSNMNAPFEYGVSLLPIIKILIKSILFLSHLTKIELVCSHGSEEDKSASSWDKRKIFWVEGDEVLMDECRQWSYTAPFFMSM